MAGQQSLIHWVASAPKCPEKRAASDDSIAASSPHRKKKRDNALPAPSESETTTPAAMAPGCVSDLELPGESGEAARFHVK